MTEDPVLEDLRERMATSTFHGWMGMSLVDAREGQVELSLEAQPHHLNLQGLLPVSYTHLTLPTNREV